LEHQLDLSPEFARIVFWICVACCVVAQVAIVRSTFKRLAARKLAGDDESGSPGSRVLVRMAPEMFWAVLPAAALILAFVGTWGAMQAVADAGSAPMHRHPPATVSGTESMLAAETMAPVITRTTAPRKHVIDDPLSDEIVGFDVGDEPETPEAPPMPEARPQ
jgi:heme/copper-type cytochrome/quinol oxidase subunit 2